MDGFIGEIRFTNSLNGSDHQILAFQWDRIIAAAGKQRIKLAQRHEFVRPAHDVITQDAAAKGRFSRGIELIIHEGIPTPSGKEKWYATSIKSILTNEKYKGDALLQKSYTTDFLTKKTKKNEGEIPQYYVKGNHEAIIDEKTFALVQTKMAARTKGQNRISSVSIFSSKIKCGDCGSWYGSKVWHSTGKYRRVIWQYNHKFDGEKCTTPTLTEDEIKRLFLQAANIAITEREELISVTVSFVFPHYNVCDCKFQYPCRISKSRNG